MREIGGFRYSWPLRSIPRTARMTMLWSKPKGLGQGHCARDRDHLQCKDADQAAGPSMQAKQCWGEARSIAALDRPHEHREGAC
jgi:hypothetical protein